MNTGSAIGRMRAALEHRDRVREIFFRGYREIFRQFTEATDYHFPALERLALFIPQGPEPEIPAAFLKGPDRSDLPLRRLGLYGGSIDFSTGISALLLSTTALADLALNITTSNPEDYDPSQASSLVCLRRGTQRLRNLDLIIPYDSGDYQSASWNPPVPKDTATTVSMSELTHFRYSGPNTFLNNLMSRLSAPSFRDVRLNVCTESLLPHLSRVIDDVREDFRSVSIAFDDFHFRLLFSPLIIYPLGGNRSLRVVRVVL
jgi:hypothetical protein